MQGFPSEGTTPNVAHKREKVSLQKSESESECECASGVAVSSDLKPVRKNTLFTGVPGFRDALFARNSVRTTRCSGSHIRIRSHSLSKERLSIQVNSLRPDSQFK